ncbi:LuxR C-terminal-related transcriptional regulator [Bacillus cytotoxicus]|nr:response regulator transcription factor [Bacillus cytotoxicus]
MGKELCISISTVKTHSINIYTKFQVSNCVEAVKKVLELGVITKKN